MFNIVDCVFLANKKKYIRTTSEGEMGFNGNGERERGKDRRKRENKSGNKGC